MKRNEGGLALHQDPAGGAWSRAQVMGIRGVPCKKAG